MSQIRLVLVSSSAGIESPSDLSEGDALEVVDEGAAAAAPAAVAPKKEMINNDVRINKVDNADAARRSLAPPEASDPLLKALGSSMRNVAEMGRALDARMIAQGYDPRAGLPPVSAPLARARSEMHADGGSPATMTLPPRSCTYDCVRSVLLYRLVKFPLQMLSSSSLS